MRVSLLLPLLLGTGKPTFAANEFRGDPVPLFRQIFVWECNSKGECSRLVSPTATAAQVAIPLARVRKGGVSNLHGENHLEVKAAGLPFRADLAVNIVHGKAHIYAVLRSGPGTKRHGVTRTFPLAESASAPVILTDRKIEKDGKSYRAELIVSATEIPENSGP